jgi:hypothetical protein
MPYKVFTCQTCQAQFRRFTSASCKPNGYKFCGTLCANRRTQIKQEKRVRIRLDESVLLAKFLKNMVKVSNGCWIWTASNSGTNGKEGYGLMWDGVRIIGAHCFSYEAFIGPITPGLNVCHTCDMPPCVNPAHLFLGTVKDNQEDAKAKGRTCPGEKNGNHKLTEEIVQAIRSDTRSSWVCCKDYGVSQCTVVRIRNKQIWAHLQ